jgi:hypothetical protein
MRSIYKLYQELGLNKEARHHLAGVVNGCGINTWDKLAEWEKPLRMYAFGNGPDPTGKHLDTEQAHTLYAAIWFGNNVLTDVTGDNKIDKFKMHGKKGFNKYYKTFFLSERNEYRFPHGMTSEDESTGTFGNDRQFDQFPNREDESTDEEDTDED